MTSRGGVQTESNVEINKSLRSNLAQEGRSSKVSRFLATLRGVLPPASGVFHGFCAGLGVM